MLKNAYLLAETGADTAENERILPKFSHTKIGKFLAGPGRPILGVGHRLPEARGGPRTRILGRKKEGSCAPVRIYMTRLVRQKKNATVGPISARYFQVNVMKCT